MVIRTRSVVIGARSIMIETGSKASVVSDTTVVTYTRTAGGRPDY